MSQLTRVLDAVQAPSLPDALFKTLSEIFSDQRFARCGVDVSRYLREGEEDASRFEELFYRTYSEGYERLRDAPAPSLVKSLLESTGEWGLIVFDAFSLREIPMVAAHARSLGFDVRERSYALAPLPTNSEAFDRERLGCGSRKDFFQRRHPNFHSEFFDTPARSASRLPSAPRIAVASTSPDTRFGETGTASGELYPIMLDDIRTVLSNVLPQLGQRPVYITSDHGYIFCGAGLTWSPGGGGFVAEDDADARWKRAFGSYRRREGSDAGFGRLVHTAQAHHFERATIAKGEVFASRGRFHWTMPTDFGHRVFKHEGWSLLEIFSPYMVIQARS